MSRQASKLHLQGEAEIIGPLLSLFEVACSGTRKRKREVGASTSKSMERPMLDDLSKGFIVTRNMELRDETGKNRSTRHVS
jgi:hypothetical protein